MNDSDDQRHEGSMPTAGHPASPERPHRAATPPHRPPQLPPRPWWHRIDDLIWASPADSTRGLTRFVQRWLQILQRSLHGFVDHDGLGSAASLTYTTLITLVPLLAVLLAAMTVLGIHDKLRESIEQYPLIQAMEFTRQDLDNVQADLLEPTTETLTRAPALSQGGTTAVMTEDAPTTDSVVYTGTQLVDDIFKFVNNARLEKLGLLGSIGLLWAVLVLLSKVEHSLNKAWAIRRRRPLGRRIMDYFNILILFVFMLAGLSATTSSRVLASKMGYIPGMTYFGEFIFRNIAYLFIWPAFMMVYSMIPNTPVKWRSAFAGGLFAGTLYQILQILFLQFSHQLVGRYKIYGSFAILFVLFFWIFISWAIVLWGAEICSAHQNLRDVRRRRRVWGNTPVERETLALRLASLLAAPMIHPSRHQRMDDGDLADALNCPPEPLTELLELFRDNDLIIQSAENGTYSLASSPERLTVLDILRLVRQGTLNAPETHPGALFSDRARRLKAPLRQKTLSDLAQLPLDQIHTLTL